MTKTFFSIKQGDHLSLGSLPGKGARPAFIDPPGFFLSTHPETLMKVNPVYKDVLFLPEKIKNTEKLIKIYKDTIAIWELEAPSYPLLFKVKEQLARSEKLLQEITGGRPCQ